MRWRVRLVVEVRHHLDARPRPLRHIAVGTVYAVESSADWNTLLRVLQSTVRPFAVCVVRVG